MRLRESRGASSLSNDTDLNPKISRPLVLVLASAAIAVSVLVGQLSSNFVVRQIKSETSDRLNFYATRLESAVNKLRHLPIAIGEHPAVKSALTAPTSTHPANIYLQTVNSAAGGEALYILDPTGLTIAASNWDKSYSFVGHNYGFRPYFRQALLGDEGLFFAVGATTGKPGVFISRPISSAGTIVGVAVIKIGVDVLTEDWDLLEENILVTDGDGIVFLSTNPDWRYKSIQPLTDTALGSLAETRKYASVRIAPLTFAGKSGEFLGRVELQNEEFQAASVELPFLNWKLHYLASLSPAETARWMGVLIGVALSLVIGTGLLYLRERRMKLANAIAAEDAAKIREANRLLEEEVAERRKVENELRETQSELVQAGKLAALGQMSAAIAHEVNQPITAIRTFVSSGQVLLSRSKTDEVANNLNHIGQLTERLASITGQLKSFSRKTPGIFAPVETVSCIETAISLVEPQAKIDGTTIEMVEPIDQVQILGDEVRVEQIVINLLRNSLDAVRECDEKRILLRLRQEGPTAFVEVSDSGPGLDLENLAQVFDPFFTTKSTGEGIGLGLTVSFTLAKEMNGKLTAANHPSGGACFTLTLPVAEPSNQAAE